MDRVAVRGATSNASFAYSSSFAADAPPSGQAVGQQLVVQNKRKEKARIAARARRSQEASIIMEMANELHITQEKMRRIDKATIIKLAIDYIKAFNILCKLKSSLAVSSQSSYLRERQPHSGPSKVQKTSQLEQHQAQPQAQSKPQAHSQAQTLSRPLETQDHLERVEAPEEELAQQAEQPQQQHLLGSMPKLSTSSIFAPRTHDVDTHFLIINEKENGESSLVLKPDSELLDDDDLTHLAPQAGDISISLDVEPLDGIVLDKGLFVHSGSPPAKKASILSYYGIGQAN